MGINILFLVPYPLKESPSQRFRFEQYFQVLVNAGHNYDVESFLDSHNWQTFYTSGNALKKLRTLAKGFAKRMIILAKLHRYNYVFIHREVTPAGPPIFEWLVSKVFQKKIIYDFDDAIWLTDRTTESQLLRLVKWRSKVGSICKWSYRVSCGNHYLASYARNYNSRVVYNPTTIDTEKLHNPDLVINSKKDTAITIGWTGSHSTLKYLKSVEEVLSKILKENRTVRFVVIANQKPQLSFDFDFVKWNAVTEIQDLFVFDIGIMPLPDDEWSKGKCGFKALQYMALKIPVVASPIGVNTDIIDDGVNGFLASENGDWYARLYLLISDAALRKQLGSEGRKKVIANYSVTSNARNFLALFE